MYFLSILLSFLSLIFTVHLVNGHFDEGNIGEFYDNYCLGKKKLETLDFIGTTSVFYDSEDIKAPQKQNSREYFLATGI